jgi:4-amino-4-deoxy-L-arabinose transferase-like glycosyltransferase
MATVKNKIKAHWHYVILGLIIALAAFLRMYNLERLPYSLHDDEISNAYIGRFILENGRDLNGQALPILYSDKFGDYPPVLPLYLSGLSVYFLGATPFAVRLPLAILGILSVALIYFIARWLFHNSTIAYLSALFLAVCPWHVILSRATAEGIAASFVFMLGLFLLFQAIDKNKLSWKFALAYLLLFTTYLLYPSFRVMTPLVLLPTFLLTKNANIKKLLVSMTIFAFLLTFGISRTDWGRGRYEQVSIMTSSNTIPARSLNYSLALGPGRVLEARIFNSKYVLATREFLRQYASYFSPQFLTGGDHIEPQRYNLFEHGATYWILLLVVAGVIVIHFAQPFSQKQLLTIFASGRTKFFLLLLWLCLVAPIPSALTLGETPNIHRALMMVFILAIIFAAATYLMINAKITKHWKNAATFTIILVLSLEVIYFWHTYTTLEYESNIIYRDDRKDLLAHWLIDHANQYDRIIIPDEGGIVIAYLFYRQDFSSQHIGEFGQYFQTDHFENLYLASDVCQTATDQKILYPDDKILAITLGQCSDTSDITFTTADTLKRRNLITAYTIQEPDFVATASSVLAE